MNQIDHTQGVTAPEGFRAAGVHCGIKHEATDLALLVSDTPAAVAGVFTRNQILGAHVGYCRDRIGRTDGRAVVINSGNANACTGPEGEGDVEAAAAAVAAALESPVDSVFVCSTGVIGVRLPIDRLIAGIALAEGALSRNGGTSAATAIMTTDSSLKQGGVRLELPGGTVTIGGMAKGAGMIEPNMATVLAFLTTDAAVAPDALQEALAEAVDGSFNRISVDGDQSCNDTVLFMANGATGIAVTPDSEGWEAFKAAVHELCLDLALQIVRDGEGATKCVTVDVMGAMSDDDAEKVARAVANSLLVKTSWYGCDPNWGRVIDAVGYAGAVIDPRKIDIVYDGEPATRDGVGLGAAQLPALETVMKQDAFTLTIDLKLGHGTARLYACDCSHEYVSINADYTT